MVPPEPVARVLLDTPLPQLDHPLDYRVPAVLQDQLAVGQRVKVPLRSSKRVTEAYVLEYPALSSFGGALQPISSIVSSVPLVTPLLQQLAQRVAQRQAGSASDVLRLAVPPRYVRVEKAFVLEHPPCDWPAHEDATEGLNPPAVKAFTQIPLGVLEIDGATYPRWVGQIATDAARTVSAGSCAIVSVPDFRDIEMLCEYFASQHVRFLRLDAGIPPAERYLNYLKLLSGVTAVIVGNRSVLYAPCVRLGSLHLWADSDELMAEPLAPYAHARDVALIRQQIQDVALTFYDHLPSLAIQRLLDLDYLSSTPIAPVETDVEIIPTDLNSNENQARIPARPLLAIKKLATEGVVLVQVPRKGFALGIACRQCREFARCQICDGPLKQARKGAIPQCGWCGALATQWSCAHCSSPTFLPLGRGTESTIEDIGKMFPGVHLHLATADDRNLRFNATSGIVVATPGAEPLVPGGYRAVLILDGARTLGREGLDVTVDALHQWLTTAGLAAPGAQVYVTQTGSRIGAALATKNYSTLLQNELADRRALSLPPAVRVAKLTGPLPLIEGCLKAVKEVAKVNIRGPFPQEDGSHACYLSVGYSEAEQVATVLRAEIVSAATRTARSRTREGGVQRTSRLSVRMDDASITRM